MSAYLTGLSFERMILQTGRKFHLESQLKIGEELTPKNVIDFLLDRGQVNKQEYRRLEKCRGFRNKLMHEGSEDVTREEMSWTLQELCGMAEIDLEKELERRQFEDILKFGKREIIPKKHTGIEENDFDEFITLYEKCLSLHEELSHNLVSLSLVPEEISEFVPTSGGIWLPWVLGDAGNRSHMKRITLGITFKPDKIRIGLDFGSKAYDAKKEYYKFLMDGELDPLLSGLSSEYFFYETYWYYHIRGVRSVREWLKPNEFSLLKKHVKKAYRETGDKLLRGQLMTGHKYLIGKIINRTIPNFNHILPSLKRTVHNTFAGLVPVLRMVERDQVDQQ